MARNSAFSNIKTYEELETSLHMVQHQIKTNQVSKKVSQLSAASTPSFTWADAALIVIRALKKRLSSK